MCSPFSWVYWTCIWKVTCTSVSTTLINQNREHLRKIVMAHWHPISFDSSAIYIVGQNFQLVAQILLHNTISWPMLSTRTLFCRDCYVLGEYRKSYVETWIIWIQKFERKILQGNKASKCWNIWSLLKDCFTFLIFYDVVHVRHPFLKIIFNPYWSSLPSQLVTYCTVIMHERNPKVLAIGIYKIAHNLAPKFI